MVAIALVACGNSPPVDPAQTLRDGGAEMAKLTTVKANLKFTTGTVTFRGFALVSARAAVRLPSDSDTTYTIRQQDVQIALEVIISNGHVYLHLPFSGYNELTGAEAAAIPDLAKLFDAKSGLPAVIPAGRNPKNLGSEQVSGVDSVKVEATYTATQIHSMLPQLTSSGDVDAIIWVGATDHLIRKAVLSGPFGDAGTHSSVQVDLSGFNSSIAIPSPSVP